MPTSTASARREAQRQLYNANLAACPGHDVLGMLSDKWLTLIVAALEDGPLRHSDLARVVAGATQKMLTQTLRTLERNGLVQRTVHPAVPPRVDYALTGLGREILPLQKAIKTWAETHIAEIHGARAAFDQPTARDGAGGPGPGPAPDDEPRDGAAAGARPSTSMT